MNVKIASWNINSIRVRTELLKQMIEENNVDIVLLQEIKCQNIDFPVNAIQNMHLNYVYQGQKSYNGVAILSKYPLELEIEQLPLYNIEKSDEEARYIEAIINVNKKIIRIASIYVPNGASNLLPNETLEESSRFIYKLNFYERIKKRLEETKHNTNNFNDEYIIFGGDLNVAKEEIDLHNPKLNDGCVCFHPLERQKLREIIHLGLKDAFREKYPDKKQYTWWDYKTRGFDRNVGWRLDYMLSSQNVISNMIDIYVDTNTRSKTKTSDHAPIIIEFEI